MADWGCTSACVAIAALVRTGATFRGCANYAPHPIGLAFVDTQTPRRLRLRYRGSLPACATTHTYADHCIHLLRAAWVVGSRSSILRRTNHALIGPCGCTRLLLKTKLQMAPHAPPAYVSLGPIKQPVYTLPPPQRTQLQPRRCFCLRVCSCPFLYIDVCFCVCYPAFSCVSACFCVLLVI